MQADQHKQYDIKTNKRTYEIVAFSIKSAIKRFKKIADYQEVIVDISVSKPKFELSVGISVKIHS